MTANKGASETRKRIKRWVNRNSYELQNERMIEVDRLFKFINTMDDRQNKKKGGLGKK